MTAIGIKWKGLGEADKRKYNDMALDGKEQYIKDMTAYNATKVGPPAFSFAPAPSTLYP